MVRLCLDAALLGTDRHFVVDDTACSWSDDVPPETWHLNGSVKFDTTWCLDTALKLSGSKLDLQPPTRFVKAMSSLGINASVPWSKVMPALEHRSFTKRLVEDARMAMVKGSLDYYRGTWVLGNGLFKVLQPVKVDKLSWQRLMLALAGNVPALKSFEPDTDGFARPVTYDRFKTLTGRLTVTSGPQILTLKREHRNIMRSVHGDDGLIVALDFAALEARVLLYEHGRNCEELDLYGMIAKELGADMKAIKGAVISELYGSSKKALGIALGMQGKDLNDFVKKIRLYFNTRELLKRVKKQYVETGKVVNRYGRQVPIDEPLDHVMLNYYSQSTGVDVTMMGFTQVIERLAAEVPRVRPLFLLHDAILLDVHYDDLPLVKAIDHVRVKGYVQKFYLKCEELGGG